MPAKQTSKPKKRLRSIPKHRSFRLSKKPLKQYGKLPGAWQLAKGSMKLVGQNKKVFVGAAILHAVLTFVFVQGFGSTYDLNELKHTITELLGEEESQVVTGVTLFGFLVGSGAGGGSSGFFQFVLALVVSLAVIWGARQIMAGEKPRFRDTFYKGMYPLIPFTLVTLVIALQLIPLLIGNLLYATVVQNSLAVTPLENILWLLLFALLALLSWYMIVSSIFGLYISTLPDMTPMKALRSARELVLHRRLSVSLRIIALLLLLLLISAVIFIPLLIVATTAAQVLFVLMTSLSIVIVHVYMYLLYRALI